MSIKPKFRVGDWVSFPRGNKRVVAKIIEDRGRIGSKGRRLFRVHLPLAHTDPIEFEMAEAELAMAAGPAVQSNSSYVPGDSNESEFVDPKPASDPGEPSPIFQVGERVVIPFDAPNHTAKIIEDRGLIGHRGRRLYRVEWTFAGERRRTEIPEEELVLVNPPRT